MKKKLRMGIAFGCLYAMTTCFAQIPNNGFENWTNFGNYMDPNSWATPNSSSASGYYPVTRDSDHFPSNVGNYSIRMESKPSALPGIEALGGSVTGSGFNMTPDFPVTGHPTSLHGYFKYAPLNNDTMHILIALFNNSTLVATGELNSTASAANWTSFNIPISAYITANGGKIYMAAYNMSGGPPQYIPYGNSVLYIDNLSFDSLIMPGFAELEKKADIRVFPNPFSASTTVQLSAPVNNGTLEILNVYGQKVREITSLANNIINVERDNLPAGIYFLQVNENDKIVATGKMIVCD